MKGRRKENIARKQLLKSQSEAFKLEFRLKQEKDQIALAEAIRKRWYIISFDNSIKFYWDVFVIVLAIYNAIALPFQIPFVAVQNFYDDSSGLQAFEIAVDILFAIDIVLSFFTSYIDVTNGETMRQPKIIAIHYIRNGFLVDFLSTTPLVLK